MLSELVEVNSTTTTTKKHESNAYGTKITFPFLTTKVGFRLPFLLPSSGYYFIVNKGLTTGYKGHFSLISGH